jgi:hypothetical protein
MNDAKRISLLWRILDKTLNPLARETIPWLNADTSHIAIERLTLEYDSFLRVNS